LTHQGNRRRVWIVSELYFPELTSTGYFLTGIAEGLAEEFDVGVLCGQPSYLLRGVRAPVREFVNNVDVHRCWATTFDKNKLFCKLINAVTASASFFLASLFQIRRGDIVIAVTNPPPLPYLVALACRFRGASFVLLVHDVYPDVLVRLHMLSQRSRMAWLINRASKWLYGQAAHILVLGRDMQDLIRSKLATRHQRVIIATNWADVRAIVPRQTATNSLLEKLGLQDRFVVQYCGNIGRTHGIKDIVDAAELLVPLPSFHFLLIGWGARKQWAIEKKADKNLNNLTILDPLPTKNFCDGLNACDVAIISFCSGMAGISVPSRMYNVLAAGKPILAVCDETSELASVVREENIGWVIPPGRPDLIVSALREAKDNPDRLLEMSRRARRTAETKYTIGNVLPIYRNLIKGLLAN